jgi:pyridoxal phosphate enzyme (YggS family)
MTAHATIIAENVTRVRQRMADAATRAGRDPRSIRLIAVTKYVGPEEILALVRAGCTTLGENRPQQLWTKAEALTGQAIRWHLIGHLQRNKIRRTLPLVEMVQSVDSLRLITALDETAAALSRRVPILLEVNVSGDAQKHGFTPDEVQTVLEQMVEMDHLQPRGLMCMASLTGGTDVARRDFARLRELREALRPSAPDLVELSMGMSHDFEAAIEEGATMVRVGSALFEGV